MTDFPREDPGPHVPTTSEPATLADVVAAIDRLAAAVNALVPSAVTMTIEECKRCKGSGTIAGSVECSACAGSGVIRSGQ